jgi:uncharacterized membrane protein
MEEKKERPIWAWGIIICTFVIIAVTSSTIGQLGFLEIVRLILWVPLFLASVSVGIFKSYLMAVLALIMGYGALFLWLFGFCVSLE